MPAPALLLALITAQVNLPDGGGLSWLPWLLGAGVILGLWFVVARTRKRTYNAYWERRKREQERRANDPDMAPPDDSSSGGAST